MIIALIIYLVIAVASGAFFILYKDLLSLILFCVVIATPLILLIIHVFACLFTRVEAETDETVVGINKPAKLIIRVKNRSPFAITSIRLGAKCSNLFLGTEYDCSFSVSAKPFTKKEFIYEMTSEHIGNIEIIIKRAKLYDYFSFFRFYKSVNFSKIITVLPHGVPASAQLRPNNYFTSESDSYSNTKPGDDPSEVFNIRDYAPGDKLNKVHWKLTGKMDHFMVKDYSLPVSEAVLVFADLALEDTDDERLSLMDSLTKSLLSLSSHFIENSIAHYIGWYDRRNEAFCRVKIHNENDLYTAMRRMLSDTVFTDIPKMENCDYFMKRRYSHIIMLTAKPPQDIVSAFAGFDLQVSHKSVISVAENSDDIPNSSTSTLFVPVIPGKEAGCLYGIKL